MMKARFHNIHKCLQGKKTKEKRKRRKNRFRKHEPTKSNDDEDDDRRFSATIYHRQKNNLHIFLTVMDIDWRTFDQQQAAAFKANCSILKHNIHILHCLRRRSVHQWTAPTRKQARTDTRPLQHVHVCSHSMSMSLYVHVCSHSMSMSLYVHVCSHSEPHVWRTTVRRSHLV